MSKLLNDQRGVVPVLLLLAVIGLVAVLGLTSFAPFRDQFLSSLFPKDSSHAASNPISGPVNPSSLLFYSKLDNLASITSPETGFGAGAVVDTTPANDFVVGKMGNGIRVDKSGEYVKFNVKVDSVKNVEFDQGTINLWYQPNYASTDGVRHPIVGIGNWGNGGIFIEKNNAFNSNALSAHIFDSTGKWHETQVSSASYSWNAGNWVNIKLTWDSKTPTGTQNTRIYVNGTERSYIAFKNVTNTGSFPMPQETNTKFIFLGKRDNDNTMSANGVIDELYIYSAVLP